MRKDSINILYLEDDNQFYESFLGAMADKNEITFHRVATSTECIDQLNNPKWDGFIFDAKGITKKGDKPELAVLGGVLGEYDKLKIEKPYVIYTAHTDGQKTEIEKALRSVDLDNISPRKALDILYDLQKKLV